MTDVHYHFEGDTVYAIHEGRVIAKGDADKMDEVESDAVNYLKGLKSEKDEKKKKSATHVVTPNGIKGTILQRYASVWGDEVTVRLENGEVKSFASHGVKDWMSERTASANPVEGLNARLSSTYNHDRTALANRHVDLVEIWREASALIQSGVGYSDQIELDKIIRTAELEGEQIAQAIEHIDVGDVEAYAPPVQQVVPQADMGRSDDWLDAVVQDMVSETDQNDFEQVLQDDPVLLASGLDDGIVADQGASRELALSHIRSKTAGYVGDDVEEYVMQFLARFEAARRKELSTRTTTTRKEAAVATSRVEEAPDEALFG
jgi:hypothetical protein